VLATASHRPSLPPVSSRKTARGKYLQEHGVKPRLQFLRPRAAAITRSWFADFRQRRCAPNPERGGGFTASPHQPGNVDLRASQKYQSEHTPLIISPEKIRSAPPRLARKARAAGCHAVKAEAMSDSSLKSGRHGSPTQFEPDKMPNVETNRRRSFRNHRIAKSSTTSPTKLKVRPINGTSSEAGKTAI